MAAKHPVRATQCATCIFRPDGFQLSPGRMAEIQAYTLEGKPHLCHTTKRLACRGSRDYALAIWHRMGLIRAPTDEALAEAMRAAGIDP